MDGQFYLCSKPCHGANGLSGLINLGFLPLHLLNPDYRKGRRVVGFKYP
jgi:hypothetical protein